MRPELPPNRRVREGGSCAPLVPLVAALWLIVLWCVA
jgi:hypothetical protein